MNTENSALNAANTATLGQYREVALKCQKLFSDKTGDYGTSWRVLRPISVADQIYIKAWRVRNLQDVGVQKVADSVESEFIGIVNYGLIGLVQMRLPADTDFDLAPEAAVAAYQKEAAGVEKLMLRKNHDYGEAWRNMAPESLVDLILTKLLRIRQILANDGRTKVSEGLDANLADIVNYALFALIKMDEAVG